MTLYILRVLLCRFLPVKVLDGHCEAGMKGGTFIRRKKANDPMSFNMEVFSRPNTVLHVIA